MIDRDELIEEMMLRKVIRKVINKTRSDMKNEEVLEEQYLRKLIQKVILLEKATEPEESPHEKTGINVLRKTLKKIIPQIKDAYMSLTTDKAQRDSYMAHLINGMDNLLAPIEANMGAPQPSNGGAVDEEVDIDIGGSDPDDEDKFIDVGDLGLPGEEQDTEEPEVDDAETTLTKGLEDQEHDETGRNVALNTFKQIQNTIADDFGELAGDEDRELYHDYLKTNILLYRDRFEDALSTSLPEPSTPEYEAQKQDTAGNDEQPDDIIEINI